MKFFRREGDPAIIWDKERNRPLCEFVSGVFETSDKWQIEKLTALGFKSDAPVAEVVDAGKVEEVAAIEPTAEEVAEEPKKRGRKKGK